MKDSREMLGVADMVKDNSRSAISMLKEIGSQS